MELTLVAFVVVAGTVVVAIAIAAWLFPSGSLLGPLLSTPQSLESAPKSATGASHGKGGLRNTLPEEEAEPPKATEPAPGRGVARSGAAADAVQGEGAVECAEIPGAPRGPSEAWGLRFYSSDGLWLLRVLAVQRAVDDALAGGGWPPGAEPAEALKRRIWAFLDDRLHLAASGCADGQARIFDLRTGRLLVSVRHDTGARLPLGSVLLAPGPLLFTGTWDGRRHEWDAWPRRPARPSEFGRGERGVASDNVVTGLALSRDGNYLACACMAGCVLVYRAECPTLEVTVAEGAGLEELQEALKLGDHGDFLLREDLALAGVHLERDYELLQEAAFRGCKSRRDVGKLALPATLRFRFSGCLTRGHKHAWRRLEHSAAVLCLSLSPEGPEEFLYSGSRDLTLRKWVLASGECVGVYRGHTSMVRCLATNARYLASGGDDRSVRVWRKDAPELLRTLAGHADFVRGVALCPTFVERLASSGDDLRVILWDAGSGQRLRELAHGSVVAALVLRESLLVTAAEDGRLRLWRTQAGELVRQLQHPRAVTAVSVA